MSKGYGSTQRAVLGAVTNDWQAVLDLAADLLEGRPSSRAWAESVRRACKRLADDGIIELGYALGYLYRRGPDEEPDLIVGATRGHWLMVRLAGRQDMQDQTNGRQDADNHASSR